MDSRDVQVVAVEENGIQHILESEDLLERFGLNSGPVDTAAVQRSVAEMLIAIGENPSREGLVDTPRRVAKAYQELVSGYTTDPVQLMNNAIFDIEYDDMVIVNNIEFYSLCEHHMLPFVGHAHVAYIPRKRS